MPKTIDLQKGLNIPVSGTPDLRVKRTIAPGTVAVQPSDFKGLNTRLLVREGDRVLAGSPVLADKNNPNILVTSPVSGFVKEIARGDKRKLLAVLISTDEVQEYLDFGIKDPESLTKDEVKDAVLKSGLWPVLIQRPYGIVADPATEPKAIFVSAFNTAPLAVDNEFALGDELNAIQAGVDALSKIAKVHVSVNSASSRFAKLNNAEIHIIKAGKHPAGNVGVQIANISPMLKEQIAWTVSLPMLASIGKLFTTGKYDISRKVVVDGPMAIEPSYVVTVPGVAMSNLRDYYGTMASVIRFVSGDILTGKTVGEEGYLGFYDTQVTLIKEGTEPELFGWARPFRFKQYSMNRTYFNWCLGWLNPDRRYDMDTNLHGGPRAFVMPDSYYAKVVPMDIYPLYLIKACLAGDIDKMEKFGIYEVLPEDLALCEYIDPSKNDIQEIIQNGIDLMLQEMA